MTAIESGTKFLEPENPAKHVEQPKIAELSEHVNPKESTELETEKSLDLATLTEEIMAAMLVNDQPSLEPNLSQEKPLFVMETLAAPLPVESPAAEPPQSLAEVDTDTAAIDARQQAAIGQAATDLLKKLIVSDPVLMAWYTQKCASGDPLQVTSVESMLPPTGTSDARSSNDYTTLFPEGFNPSNPAHCEKLIQQSIRKTLEGMEHLSEVLQSSAELMQQQKEEAITAAATATLTGMFEQAMPGISSLLQAGVNRSAEQNILINHLCALCEDQLTRKFPHVEHRDERVLAHIVHTILPEIKHLAKRLGLNDRFQPLSVVPPSVQPKVEPAMKGAPSTNVPEFDQALRKGDHLGMVQALFRKK